MTNSTQEHARDAIRTQPGTLHNGSPRPGTTSDEAPYVPDMSMYEEFNVPVRFDFGVSRRAFVQVLGTGVLFSLAAPALAQRRGRGRRGGFARGRGPQNVESRLLLGNDGIVTVMSGKVEVGQGARAELAMAAAEELRVPADRIKMILGDTELVPDDGITAGSMTTPRTIPAVRLAAASARELLVRRVAEMWGVDAGALDVRDGTISHQPSGRSTTYAELAGDEALRTQFQADLPQDLNVSLTPVDQWNVLGTSYASSGVRDRVMGAHKYPSDMTLPGMMYGAVLRAPRYGAQLQTVDLAPAEAMEGVVAVRDNQFVGVAAPTSFQARKAIEAIAETATWSEVRQPSSETIYDHLRENAQGGVPENPNAAAVSSAPKSLRATYNSAYVQHAPMEPRAALAEWSDGKLTVWAGSQNPFGFRGELARELGVSEDSVRVIIPDTGGGFGGKHTGEVAVEAARLARAAGRPVSLRWTREEEFTWASFRAAGVIDLEASLDEQNRISSWYMVNFIGSFGNSGIQTPYSSGNAFTRSVRSRPPLREASYRALAATNNNFAREVFMDELAGEAGQDPLEFRLAHLDQGTQEVVRLRDVLEEAARRFDWPAKVAQRPPNRGVGLACGVEKGSYVACCVEVEVDRPQQQIRVLNICEAYECGAILNPNNLRAQVEGALIQGLGPALEEEALFSADGEMQNPSFRQYRVPHFQDIPEVEVHLVDRPDLDSVGAGETPVITVAPAISNAVAHATGVRLRHMPMRLPAEA